ncbi:SMI1/KNR4 family protein [Subtercola endophyticus]|uniref:SMI1/KNR4 family protein n=1 Tax=Subtercola endophyticus TaxID=2895559 RepID=UPI001E58A2D3|nr:SMI1/KNR4 family protein [Subtercola endophyticus]UFS59786.1 SMI1/KNR4 family protein [Subtercola endophyticus]
MKTAATMAIRLFRRAGIPLDPGLSEEQIRAFEDEFGFEFDADHRELLMLAVPTGRGWFDWRRSTREDIESRLAWPVEGILWDVHYNDFWPTVWGRKPSGAPALESTARQHLAAVPKLVPLFRHRFMAAATRGGGAPVFSVVQADVALYGENLVDYVARETGSTKRYHSSPHRRIEFWSPLAELDPRYIIWPEGEPRLFWNRAIEGGFVHPTHVTKEGGPLPVGSPIEYKAYRT